MIINTRRFIFQKDFLHKEFTKIQLLSHLMGKKEELFVTEDFDDAGVLGVDGDAVGFEVVEVGACRGPSCGGIPPVGVGGYVAAVIDLVAVAVVDGELVVFEAVVFYQAFDDEAVV